VEFDKESVPMALRSSTLLKGVKLFATMCDSEINAAASHLIGRTYEQGEKIIRQGEAGTEFFIMKAGKCIATVQEGASSKEIMTYKEGDSFGERALLRSDPRAATVTAASQVEVLVLSADNFRRMIAERDRREECLRGVKLLEMMSVDQIAKAAGLLERRHYESGQKIIHQGDDGNEVFIIDSGRCIATVKTGADEQEVKRYEAGDLFGELALMKNSPRAATVTALTSVNALVLSRQNFEKELGSLSALRADQYLADPRKLISDFYLKGDHRGSAGTLLRKGLKIDPKKQTSWFCVCRPCSKDSIAKMLGRIGVGKGLNIKGKSAKKNRLSGFVPFLQISDNTHKAQIEASPSDSRVRIFYQSEEAREDARTALTTVLKGAWDKLRIDDESINLLDEYKPDVYGLELPEVLMREAYIMKPDISPMVGWETGRNSIPHFQDMNLHSIRGPSKPHVVLYQFDLADAMNPLGLLIAYAEKYVKPVVSDFDVFSVGSKGMIYNSLPEDQAKLMDWCLDRCEEILDARKPQDWTTLWLEVLHRENAKGFHPEIPAFGYGDPTSVGLIEDIVDVASPCGAVRHGAECSNFTFPQELDDEYLVVWEGFSNASWEYLSEPDLRKFLLERVAEGFAFPLNPAWPVRDKGWYDVWQALASSKAAAGPLNSWYSKGARQKIDLLHEKYPNGFGKKP